MFRSVDVPRWPPRRIVSVVPSQTELLADLGLEPEVVGISKFCVHPAEWFHKKTRIGGPKTLDPEKISALQPDLILGNKEENQQEQIEALAARFPVWMSDIRNLGQALEMIGAVGRLTGREEKANAIAAEIGEAFYGLQTNPPGKRRKAAYLIWRKPYMAAGSATFIDDMLRIAGFDNVFGHLQRYPETGLPGLAAARPEVILLSSEPYPFAEKHVAEIKTACPSAEVLLVDGELFSWYGSRLRLAPPYFRHLQDGLLKP